MGYFQNFPKISAKIGSNLKKKKIRLILVKIGPIWYMKGPLILQKLEYVWVHFQIPKNIFLPKQKFRPPLSISNVCAFYMLNLNVAKKM